VARLLASPHFGERMAIGWLDVVRFADTIGYHSDNPRPVWPYRDYVITSFNTNKPFDRFTIEQLAGDLLPNATQETRIASALTSCCWVLPGSPWVRGFGRGCPCPGSRRG
jgi:hypothetical protein